MEYESVHRFEVPVESLEAVQLEHLWKQILGQRGDENGRIMPLMPNDDVPLISSLIETIGKLEQRIIALESKK